MKRHIAILIFLCSAILTVNAQHMGFYGGVNLSNACRDLIVDGRETKIYTKPLAGLNAGFFSEINLQGPLNLNMGLSFTQKGVVVKNGQYVPEFPCTTRVTYMEFPVNLYFNFDLGPNTIFAGAGPYMAVALSGKTVDQDDNETLLDFGNEEGEMKLFDYGVNLGAGFGNDAFRLMASYSFGIPNLSNFNTGSFSTGSESVYRTRGLSVSIAMLFY